LPGFRKRFSSTGRQGLSVLWTMPVSIEQHIEWIADCIDHMRRSGKSVIEATPQAQEAWVEHVNEIVGMTLYPCTNSWYMSANIPGKPRAFLPYLNPEGVGGYRRRCDEIAASGSQGFKIT